MSKSKIKDICDNAIIASIYFILTFFNPFGFTAFQLRIAEILVILPFYKRSFIYGVTIGCVLANIGSPLGFVDIFVGGFSTLLCCLFIGCVSRRLWQGCLFTVVVNSLLIAVEEFMFLDLPFWISFLYLCISEIVVLLIGYVLFFFLSKRNKFLQLIKAEQHLKWEW